MFLCAEHLSEILTEFGGLVLDGVFGSTWRVPDSKLAPEVGHLELGVLVVGKRVVQPGIRVWHRKEQG